jgi:hypothetical protein
MNRSSLRAFASIACLLALAACETHPKLETKGTVPITLSSDQKAPIFNAKLFNLITITLPPPKQPGYGWQIGSHDAQLLQQKTELLPSTTPGNGPTISFIARAPGRARVRFQLLPNTATRVADPLEQLTATIVIE